jgi:hypothetical protein
MAAGSADLPCSPFICSTNVAVGHSGTREWAVQFFFLQWAWSIENKFLHYLHVTLPLQVFANPLMFFVLTGTTWVHLLISWITAWLITWRTSALKWGISVVSESTVLRLLWPYLKVRTCEFFRTCSIFCHRVTFSFLSYVILFEYTYIGFLSLRNGNLISNLHVWF